MVRAAAEHAVILPSPDLAHGEDERPTSPRDWLLAGNDPARVAELAGGLP